MAFIRRVRTASGATAVQIAEYAGGWQRIVKHVGFAHTAAELGVLLEMARGLLADPGQEHSSSVSNRPRRWWALVEEPGTEQHLAGIDPPSVEPQHRDRPGRVLATGSRVLLLRA